MLALNFTQGDNSKEDEDVAHLYADFIKSWENMIDTWKEKNISRSVNGNNDLCHKWPFAYVR